MSEMEQSKRPADTSEASASTAARAKSGGAAPDPDGSTERRRRQAVPSSVSPWTAAAFFAGLSFVYLGQRILVDWAAVALSATLLGAALATASTVARFFGAGAQRDRHAIARLLGGLQVLGLLGLGIYFASTAGSSRFGIGDDAFSQQLLGVLQVAWVSCLALSVGAVVFAEFALHPMRSAELLEWRRVRSAATSGASLMLAGAYCSLFVYSAAQQEAQADFSYFKTSEPGEATVKLVERMTDRVSATAFFPQVNEVRDEVEKYLRQLESRSDNFDYEIIDRYARPKRAEELRVVRDGTIVLSRGESREKLSIATDIGKARSRLKELDKDFNARLMKLLRERRVAYLTSGHGELNDQNGQRAEGRSAEIFEQLLEQQNFRVQQLGVADGLAQAVPKDADLVLVLGPTSPFAPEEVASLKRYVDGGGELFMALDVDAVAADDTVRVTSTTASASSRRTAGDDAVPRDVSAAVPAQAEEQPSSAPAATDPPSKPEISRPWVTELAAVAGAELVPTVLADERQHVVRRNQPSDRIILPTDRFSSHASVSTLSRGTTQGVVVLGAGHFLKRDTGAVRSDVTVRTATSTFADDNRNYRLDPGEKTQMYNLGMALTRKNLDGAALKQADASDNGDDKQPVGGVDGEMRAFLFADADAFSDLLMARVVGNQMLAFDAIRWLVGEESLAGQIESERDVPVETTKQVDMVWFYATIFGVPALVLGAGVGLSRRARRKGGSKK